VDHNDDSVGRLHHDAERAEATDGGGGKRKLRCRELKQTSSDGPFANCVSSISETRELGGSEGTLRWRMSSEDMNQVSAQVEFGHPKVGCHQVRMLKFVLIANNDLSGQR